MTKLFHRFFVCGLFFYIFTTGVAFTQESLTSLDELEDEAGMTWDDFDLFPPAALFQSNRMEVEVANHTGFGYNSSNRTNKHRGSYLSHLNLYSKGQVRYLPLYLSPIIIVLGVIGNIISFIVLYKFARSQRLSGDFFLCALAIFDTGGLLFSSFPFWANTFLRADLGMRGITSPFQRMLGEYGACHFWFYVSFNFRYFSHWTIVIFSIERFLILKNPFEASTRYTIRRAAITIAGLIAVTCVCNLHMFFMFDKGILPGGKTICKWKPIFYKANFIHLFFMAFVPSILIIVFNSLIIRELVKHRKEDPRVVGEEGKSRESAVTRRIVAVSIGFIVLTLPFMGAAYYRNIESLRGVKDFPVVAADLFSFCLCLYLTNYACNFVLYCVTGKRFRDSVFELFRCEKLCPIQKSKDTTDSSRRTSSTMLSPDRGSLLIEQNQKNHQLEAAPLTDGEQEAAVYQSSV